ncbi:MAG: hypothetical protein C0392_08125 [Syntrophus sp. (in: bacteria)]|nr:hypothetical protein [Syntrophus sp. (in: bacteria)]
MIRKKVLIIVTYSSRERLYVSFIYTTIHIFKPDNIPDYIANDIVMPCGDPAGYMSVKKERYR